MMVQAPSEAHRLHSASFFIFPPLTAPFLEFDSLLQALLMNLIFGRCDGQLLAQMRYSAPTKGTQGAHSRSSTSRHSLSQIASTSLLLSSAGTAFDSSTSAAL